MKDFHLEYGQRYLRELINQFHLDYCDILPREEVRKRYTQWMIELRKDEDLL